MSILQKRREFMVDRQIAARGVWPVSCLAAFPGAFQTSFISYPQFGVVNNDLEDIDHNALKERSEVYPPPEV